MNLSEQVVRTEKKINDLTDEIISLKQLIMYSYQSAQEQNNTSQNNGRS